MRSIYEIEKDINWLENFIEGQPAYYKRENEKILEKIKNEFYITKKEIESDQDTATAVYDSQ